MSVSAADVIKVAKGEAGYHEGFSNGHWNNKQKYSPAVPGLEWSDYQAWCATFVSWCALKAGAEDLYPRTASCYTAVQWFKQRGRFSEYPAIGAQIFFGSGGGSHTGIVYDYDDTYAYTVEGNTNDSGSAEGDGVYLKRRVRRDSYVYGYGLPKFAGGIKSADPKFASEAPKATAPAPKPSVSLSAVVYGATHAAKDERKHPGYADDVERVQNALVANGRLKKGSFIKGIFDVPTKAAYAAEQRAQGYRGADADGVPGKASLTALGNKRGFRVVA